MSLDIWIQTFEGQKAPAFARSIVERAFLDNGLIDSPEGNEWMLKHDDGKWYGCYMSIDEQPEITSFAINRPPLAEPLFRAIFEVLRQTRCVFMWPEEAPACCCVGNPEALAGLPADVVEFFQPAVVSSPAELEDLFFDQKVPNAPGA